MRGDVFYRFTFTAHTEFVLKLYDLKKKADTKSPRPTRIRQEHN